MRPRYGGTQHQARPQRVRMGGGGRIKTRDKTGQDRNEGTRSGNGDSPPAVRKNGPKRRGRERTRAKDGLGMGTAAAAARRRQTTKAKERMGWDGTVRIDHSMGEGDPSQSHPKPPRVRYGGEQSREPGSFN